MKSKKILLVILITLVIVISNISFVYADSFNVKLTSDKQNYAAGQTVIVKVSLSDIDSSIGLYGLSGVLEYDTNIFEPITSDGTGNITSTASGITSLNNWGNPTFNSSSNEFSVLTTSPTKSNQSIMQISLKVKEGAQLGKAVVMLRELQASNGADDIDTSPVTLSINIKDPSEVDDGNIPTIVTTPSPSPSPSAKPTTTPTAKTTPTPVVKTTPTPSGKLPQTGVEDYAMPVLLGALVISLISYIAYRRYKDI